MGSGIKVAAIAILCAGMGAGTARGEAPKPVEIEVLENIEYGVGGEEKLMLDLARPKERAAPLPAVVFIHGGGWAGGNRKGHFERMKRAAEAGFVSATVSYRLAKEGKNLLPAQIEDSKCAIRFLRANAKRLGLDPERIGAVGDSAGGHLVMLLGTMEPADGLEGNGGSPGVSSKVQAVVAYYGPTNLVREFPAAAAGIIKNAVGGTLAEKRAEYERISPVKYVNAGDAPMLIFHGTKDQLVPYEQAFEMATALSQAGVPGRVEILLGDQHGWGGEKLARTEQATLDFFRSVLTKKE